MFFKGESYQGASKYIYPYGLNDVISNKKMIRHGKHLYLKMNILNYVSLLKSVENYTMEPIKQTIIISFIKTMLLNHPILE